MSDNQSPARSNNPGPATPPGNAPHAGFRDAQPLGTGGAATTGPTLTGWPRDLGWSEFSDRNSRPAGESEDAQISVQLQGREITVVREKGRFRLGDSELPMAIDAADSWVVKDKKSATLLAHEQGHYDIAGLCYRDMVNELRRLREKSPARLGRAVTRVMDKHDKRGDELSDLYDSKSETDHGLNQKRQQAWEVQISACKTSGMPMTNPD